MLPEPPGPNVIAIPFPMESRTVKFGAVGSVLDFVAWKKRMTENNGKTNGETNGEEKTHEEFERMGSSDKKLFVIKKLVQVMDQLDESDITELYRILTKPENGG